MKGSLIKLGVVLFLPLYASTPALEPSATESFALGAGATVFHPCTPRDTITSMMTEILSLRLQRTDSVAVGIRQEFGLPTLLIGPIVLETDTLACRRVRRKLDSLLNTFNADSTRRVLIARVDTLYVVEDPLSPIAYVRGASLVMTQDYRYVGAWR